MENFVSLATVCKHFGYQLLTTTKTLFRCLKDKTANALTMYLLEPSVCEYTMVVESPWLCEYIASLDDNGTPIPKTKK